MLKSRFLTGIQPTGQLHLGNFISSILPWLRLQSSNFPKELDETSHLKTILRPIKSFERYKHEKQLSESLFSLPKWATDADISPAESDLNLLFIADLHSYSTKFNNPNLFQVNNEALAKEAHDALVPSSIESLDLLAMLLACGVDPDKTVLFVQSDVPAHSELFYLLNCLTPQFLLNNMIQFKEKKSKMSSVGLFTYPVLMASDILLYAPEFIPVGDDQQQHLELTRLLARRFNHATSTEVFRPPQQIDWNSSRRLMSFTDISQKMSKSSPSKKGIINLKDSIESITHKVAKAKTDSEAIVSKNANRLELFNLLQLYATLEGISLEETLK